MWQRRHECNFLGRHGRPETPPGVGQQFKAQVFVCRDVVLDDDEGLDDLAGQHIRLAGQGMPGLGQGTAGDLYLEIEFRPHPLYRVEQRDVYFDLRIAPWEAALGAAVEVPTPGGTVELKIPAGAAAGRKLRLKGRGIPSSATPGDLYLELEIAVPGAVTPEQKTAWEALKQTYPGFDPRIK